MRRTAVALVVPVLAVLLLDFYQALGVDYTHSQGYVPSKVQDPIDEYC